MLERTYKADRFEDAIAQVKRELGPDAVIVSSRQIAAGLIGGRPQFEITAVPHGVGGDLSRAHQRTRNEGPGLVERSLVRNGLPTNAARTIAARVRDNYGGEPTSMGAARHALEAALRAEMIFTPGVGVGAARAVALVGPTGVGKTTTIAKIAAHEALVQQRAVALVSLDQYRIGGAEQLERYAELIGIPMDTAHDAASLAQALRRFSQAELVLIDTAGRSPRDQEALQATSDFLHRAKEPVDVHLCVATGMQDCELSAVIDRHAVIRPTKLIATKLDEAVFHGSIVAAQMFAGLPLAYFTTGQRVPEDIEIASPARLAALFCGDEVN